MNFSEFLKERVERLNEAVKSFDDIPNIGGVQSVINNKLFKLEVTLHQLRITKNSRVVKVGSYKENIKDVVSKLNKLHDGDEMGSRVRGFVVVRKSGSSVFVINNRKNWSIDLQTLVGCLNVDTRLGGLQLPSLETIETALKYEYMLDDEQKTVYAFFDDANQEK